MGRIAVAAIVALTMSGCAMVAAVSGTAVDGLVYLFQGAEESFSINMRAALVAVQRGLEKSGLHANVLEPAGKGYIIALGNENLDGQITLEKRTKSLTTITIKIKSGAMRQDSVERALVEAIKEQSKHIRRSDRFDFRGYHNIREKPDVRSKKIGWFLPGTLLDVSKTGKSEWMLIRMPSGAEGYLKGSLAGSAGK